MQQEARTAVRRWSRSRNSRTRLFFSPRTVCGKSLRSSYTGLYPQGSQTVASNCLNLTYKTRIPARYGTHQGTEKDDLMREWSRSRNSRTRLFFSPRTVCAQINSFNCLDLYYTSPDSG